MVRSSFRFVLFALLAVLLVPAAALAAEEEEEAEAGEELEYFEVGIGVFWVPINANFIDEPTGQDIRLAAQEGESTVVPDYPGFAGVTGATGFGFQIDVRIIEYIGLELNLFHTTDRGSADITLYGADVPGGEKRPHEFTLEIRHDAWHIPLLLKGVLVGEVVQPSLFVGPEFVIVGNAEAEVTAGENPYTSTTFEANAHHYMFITFGIGLEFKLPIPAVDVRIPLNLRAGINPDTPGDRYALEKDYGTSINELSKVVYHTAFQYEALITLGASMHF